MRPAAVHSAAATNAVTHNPPLALAYLASSLRHAGHHVLVIDAFGEAPDRIEPHPDGYHTRGLRAEELSARVPDDVDLIGVTCMFSNEWIYCRETLRRLAEDHPGVPILLGGETKYTMRRVMDFCDGWFPRVGAFADPAASMAKFRDFAEEAGRDPASVSTSLFGATAEQGYLAKCREAGVDRALLVLPPEGRDGVLKVLDKYQALLG